MPVSFVSDKYSLKQWKFPGGEIGVKFENAAPSTQHYHYHRFDVTGIVTSDDIITLIMAVDALHVLGVSSEEVYVFMPYLPYARQDRVCHPGETNSLAMFILLLSNIAEDICSFVVSDVHSDASKRLLEIVFGKKLMIESQFRIVAIAQGLDRNLPEFDAVVAPDAGAAEKAAKIQVGTVHLQLTKERTDGKVQTSISSDQLDKVVGSACIFDDICDGGATFIAAAKVLKETQPRMTSLNLYVTHGIFSAGVDKLLEMFDNIYVYNLMSADSIVSQKVKVI